MKRIKYLGEHEFYDDDVVFYAEAEDGSIIKEVYHLELAGYFDEEGNEIEVEFVD